MLRIVMPLAAVLAALAVAACGSDDTSKTTGSSSGSAATQKSTTGAKDGTATPGNVAPAKARTPKERRFVSRLNARCTTARRRAGSVSAPTAASASRSYSRRALPAVRRQIAVLRTSRPSRNQVVAVASLLGGYGQAQALMRTVANARGELRPEARLAAKQLLPALRRVRNQAAAAALPGCRPPGL